ncbi:hypothetical protein BGW38_006318 [Lunasporangiospora selenospora]|uniref:F-box domain-containing protein n=1 Tax=Lunasporangiospora selenospora TaxID=979761 RepID=A0A9P6FZ35_9FUNG|nr:hypothetical protein BGW38_006318 [Lunasporangiospora selenospora]
MDTYQQDSGHSQDQDQDQDPSQSTQRIEQRSIFAKLPPELILEIMGYLDILAIFRFLDTCRYHRYLLLNLPEAWRKVRFVPMSEYANLASLSLSSSSLSASTTNTITAAAAVSLINGLATESTGADGPSAVVPDPTKIVFAKKRDPRRLRPKGPTPSSQKKSTGARSGSDLESSGSEDDKVEKAERLKHQENERDRDRGGSRSLISETYAVLRRFRKENRLVDFVREVYMDSTDSPQFPSPLVMLIKFPNLEVLSSRYRRHQTSLANDASMLKDILRSGDIVPHSLRLRRWEIFHPYMTQEDIHGFRQVLNDITIVGEAAALSLLEDTQHTQDSSASRDSDQKEAVSMKKKHSQGIILDIQPCPGLITPSSELINTQILVNNGAQHNGGGLHWAPPPGSTPQPAPLPTPASNIASNPPPSSSSPPPCTNIVWSQERCRFCNAPQERCWKCVPDCGTCKALRSPPYINHQTILERERSKLLRGSATTTTTATTNPTGVTSAPESATVADSSSNTTQTTSGNPSQDLLAFVQPQATYPNRPTTPPGSISLTQMLNSTGQIPTAYPAVGRLFSSTGPGSGSRPNHPPPLLPVNLVPEFSLFD